MAKAPTDGKNKRNKIATRVYVNAEGKEFSSAIPDAVSLRFDFHDGPDGGVKTQRTIKMEDYPQDIVDRLKWHGASQNGGDPFAKAKGNVAEAIDLFDTHQECLAGGEWSERKKGEGARPSMVLAAVIAMLEAKGETVDDARKARLKEKVSTTEGRKKARARADVEFEYQKILSAHQAEKEKAAKAKAKGVETDTSEYA